MVKPKNEYYGGSILANKGEIYGSYLGGTIGWGPLQNSEFCYLGGTVTWDALHRLYDPIQKVMSIYDIERTCELVMQSEPSKNAPMKAWFIYYDLREKS